ncbi:ATP-binding protein [Streptomyces diastatochromogenes]|nr:ATP-binding protein [Streptomyces diastatochromogenes]
MQVFCKNGPVDTHDSTYGVSVLLSFKAENTHSFKDQVELSLLATSIADDRVVREVPWRAGGKLIKTLPVAGLFGANASGKSNVLKAMHDMRVLVLSSFRHGAPAGGVSRTPFLLSAESRQEPTSFAVDIILNGVRHEYSFAVNDDRVLTERAVRYPHGKSALLFERLGDEVTYGSSNRARSKAVKALLRPNALFLSTAASAGHPDLLPLYTWFARNLLFADAQSRMFRQGVTHRLLNDDEAREKVLQLLQAADLGITGAKRQPMDPDMKRKMERVFQILTDQEGDSEASKEASSTFEDLEIRLTHQGEDGEVEFSHGVESLGTLVWFGLIGPIIEALAAGAVFLADELDASLHPSLVAEVVRLFQNPEANPHQAQLIFNSHDATLMGDSSGDRLLGRDQIWFTEKHSDGSTHLYPLSDLDPRKEEAIGRRYLSGRYGAVPIITKHDFMEAALAITSGGDR